MSTESALTDETATAAPTAAAPTAPAPTASAPTATVTTPATSAAPISTAPTASEPTAAAPPAAAPSPAAAFPVDLATAGVRKLLAGLDAGEFSSVELTAAYLERIERLSVGGPHLNAVRAVNPTALEEAAARDAERASGAALGALHGVPVLLKDNIDVAGMPTTAGSLALEHSYPAGHAPLTAALRAAGAVILGKTNLTEFSNYLTAGMPGGYSSLGGQVLNPYDSSLTPSGSSAGSGSAAAAGLAAGTIGSDTGGSIIAPAQANSLVGVRPTVGLVSRTGIVPICATQDTAGPMTRYVYDSAALLTAITGIDPEDAYTSENPLAGTDFVAALSETALAGARIGFLAEDGDEVYARSLELLQARGAALVAVTVGHTDAPEVLNLEMRRDLNAYLARLPESGGQPRTMAQIIAFNDAHPDATLKYGQSRLLESEAFDLADPASAAHHEAVRSRSLRESRHAIDSVLESGRLDAIVSNCTLFEVGAQAGYPSVVVPAGYLEHGRRPAGLLFLGTAWTEPRLLAFAYDFEQAAQVWQPPERLNPSLFR